MKKFFTILLLSLFSFQVPGYADEWDNMYSEVENAWDGQKTITESDFEEVMEHFESQKEKKEEKKKFKKLKLKGKDLHNNLDVPQFAPDKQQEKSEEQGQLLNIPVNLVYNEFIISPGHYKVIGSKKDGNVFLNFYQAHNLIAQIPAKETLNDFGEDKIDFVKLKFQKDSQAKIIFGSLDFNAYTFIDFTEP